MRFYTPPLNPETRLSDTKAAAARVTTVSREIGVRAGLRAREDRPRKLPRFCIRARASVLRRAGALLFPLPVYFK